MGIVYASMSYMHDIKQNPNTNNCSSTVMTQE